MIDLIDVSKSYEDKVLFDKLNISIAEKEKILLKAPSGSGKTTLIQMLMGFQKVDTGSIVIDQKTLSKTTLRSIREKIAYVSQDADLTLTTIDALLEDVFSYKVNKHILDYRETFIQYCATFSLDQRIILKEIKSISGGERQRVALIIALLLERPILILDEITSGLDQNLKELIKSYILELDKTIIIISHDDLWTQNKDMREVALNAIN